MRKMLVLFAMLLAIGFGSYAFAGSVNVDLDNDCADSNRNVGVLDNDADPVTIWLTVPNDKHLQGQYTVLVTPKGGITQSVCISVTQCGDPDEQWYWGQVSFDSLLNTDPVGQLNVQVRQGCDVEGKVVGGQTVTVTQ